MASQTTALLQLTTASNFEVVLVSNKNKINTISFPLHFYSIDLFQISSPDHEIVCVALINADDVRGLQVGSLFQISRSRLRNSSL